MPRNKSRFNRLADGIGSALGKHAEWRKPSLSKADPLAPAPVETRARESLLTPSQRARARSASQASQVSVKTTASASTTNTMDKPSSLADVELRYREESEMVRAAQEAVMHRPNFAIDAIGDSDGEDDEEETADDGVMDEVEAFLKAHGGEDDTAVKGAAKKEAEGEFRFQRCVCGSLDLWAVQRQAPRAPPHRDDPHSGVEAGAICERL